MGLDTMGSRGLDALSRLASRARQGAASLSSCEWRWDTWMGYDYLPEGVTKASLQKPRQDGTGQTPKTLSVPFNRGLRNSEGETAFLILTPQRGPGSKGVWETMGILMDGLWREIQHLGILTRREIWTKKLAAWLGLGKPAAEAKEAGLVSPLASARDCCVFHLLRSQGCLHFHLCFSLGGGGGGERGGGDGQSTWTLAFSAC